MRVITFQNEDVINKIVSSEEFSFTNLGRYKRSKEVDLNVEEGKYPIYGFVSLAYNDKTGLSLPSIYYNWAYLIGFMQLDKRDFIELEIPEFYISAIRSVNSNIDLKYPDCLYYKSDSVEAVFYQIKREWIVSVHRADNNFCGYSIRNMTVEIVNSNYVPIVSSNYKLSGDCYAESNIFEKLPDTLYRPVKLKELTNYVNPLAHSKIIRELVGMYYSDVDLIMSNKEKLKEFKNRFADVLIY